MSLKIYGDSLTDSDRRSPFVGGLLRKLAYLLIAASAICVVVLACFILLVLKGLNPGLLAFLIIASAVVVTLRLGAYLLKLGKRMAAIPAEELLQSDTRAPVLYLSSFNEDAQKARAATNPQGWYGPKEERNWDLESEEEMLAKELGKIGPTIAVGRPGEIIPELEIGMAAVYFTDDEWHDGVRDLMTKAQLVVLRAFDTPGTLIELEMAARYMDPKKLLILMSFDSPAKSRLEAWVKVKPLRDEYAEFKVKADQILPRPLPEFHGEKVADGSLSSMVWFDDQWNPKSFKFEATGKRVRGALADVFKHY